MTGLDDVIAFIGKARTTGSADDLRRLMEAITVEMGFTGYSLYQHVSQWDWQQTQTLAISNYPRSWLETFFENEYNLFDPVLRAAQRTAVGFKWENIGDLVPLSPKQLRVLESGRREGIVDGFTVPANIAGEATGSCNFIVGPGTPLPEHNLHMAQLVGSFAYEAARQLWKRRVTIVRDEAPRLSPRQRDCLVLVAQGKTDWEIAKVLGLKQSTVNGYIDDAKAMLGVTRRPQLVMRALFEGHLSLSETVQ